jgi:hypothetical protein
MAEFLGANTEQLDVTAARFGETALVADNVRGRLAQIAADLQLFGRYGDEYRAHLLGTAIPSLAGAVTALRAFEASLRSHAEAQRGVSDGGTVLDYRQVLAGTTLGAGMAGAQVATAPQQQRTAPGTAGRHGGDRYVVYADQVRTGGSRAWRNNNPGNMEAGAFANQHGAIGSDGRFAVFPDEAAGTAAVRALLGTTGYRNLTIADAIARYAPPHENDTAAYTAGVSRMTNLDATRAISSLNGAELDAVVGAIRRVEGWQPGQAYTPASGPDWARRLLGSR